MQLSYNDTDQKIQYFCKKIENDIRFEITQKSIDRVQKKLTTNPDHPDLLFLAGKIAFNQNLLEDALKYFELAEACETKVATHFGYYGWTLLKLNRAIEAELKLEKGLKIDVNDFTTNLALGLLAYERGNYEVALDHCNRGVYSGIHEFEFLRLKALILLKLGKEISEILDIIKRAQKLGQDAELDYQYVRLLKIDGALDEAKAFTKKYVEKNPESPYDNAKMLLIAEYYDEALAHANKVQSTFEDQKALKDLIDKIEARQAQAKQKVQLAPIQQEVSVVKKISVYDQIQHFIGLEDVKQKVQNLKRAVEQHNALDPQMSNLLDFRMPHIIFEGEKGMRQPEVARLLTSLYREFNILKSDNFVEISSNVNGQLMPLLTAAIDGVVYIDVHSMLEGNDLKMRNANIQQIQQIIIYTFKHVTNPFQIILSASADKIEEIFRGIPEWRSYFHAIISFEGYSFKDVEAQFHRNMIYKGYVLGHDCTEAVISKLKELYEQKFSDLNKPTIQVAENLCNILLNELTQKMTVEDGKLITLKQFDQAYPSEAVKRNMGSLKPIRLLRPLEEFDSIKPPTPIPNKPTIEELQQDVVQPQEIVEEVVESVEEVLSYGDLNRMLQEMHILQSAKAFCHHVISNRDIHSEEDQLVYGQAIYIGESTESIETLYKLLQSQKALSEDSDFVTLSLDDLMTKQLELKELLNDKHQAVLVIKDLINLDLQPNITALIQQLIESISYKEFFIIFHGKMDSMEFLVQNDAIKVLLAQQIQLEGHAVTTEDELKLRANQMLEEQQLSQEAIRYTILYFGKYMKNFGNIEKLLDALDSISKEPKKGLLPFSRKQKEVSEQQMQAVLEKKRLLK